ncbi:MAG: prepilin peptidase [Candidatus Marinimicrobia bacterium]|jgi:leader peptidase (prepilin peptidase)/N-methyltransferase|nr:prepilin peptidase [Candidatus Neomarinimicrobiota bacterium]MBT3762963.1 prepilin peptidase [Candidatus Neomarinimicrobiota bacterium]MBT4271496.1 prepilin peptidase [Candidatus Neomarinimicrobiota bacterium]MBT4809699.1 prepilin peptidase [Candidatus Neomarinimicrobiota bacterium]MBT5175389.1 prepilin peptidase [Candidatus Neomarinimicrobiota bacterium]
MNPIFLNLILPFFFGTVIGSFLNVCIYRIPKELSVIYPGSKCPQCDTKIGWADNIPIIGFLLLKGKCRACNNIISLRYLSVEVLTGIVSVVTMLTFGFSIEMTVYLILFYILLVISVIDIEHFYIPNCLIYGILILWLMYWFNNFSLSFSIESFVASGIFGGFLWATRVAGQLVFKKEALGIGDVWLGFTLGLFLHWGDAIIALYIAFITAAIYGIGGMLSNRLFFGQKIPFGPFLAVGVFIEIILETEIYHFIELYIF